MSSPRGGHHALGAAQHVGLSLDVGRKAFSAEGVIRLLGRMAELG